MSLAAPLTPFAPRPRLVSRSACDRREVRRPPARELSLAHPSGSAVVVRIVSASAIILRVLKSARFAISQRNPLTKTNFSRQCRTPWKLNRRFQGQARAMNAAMLQFRKQFRALIRRATQEGRSIAKVRRICIGLLERAITDLNKSTRTGVTASALGSSASDSCFSASTSASISGWLA